MPTCHPTHPVLYFASPPISQLPAFKDLAKKQEQKRKRAMSKLLGKDAHQAEFNSTAEIEVRALGVNMCQCVSMCVYGAFVDTIYKIRN